MTGVICLLSAVDSNPAVSILCSFAVGALFTHVN